MIKVGELKNRVIKNVKSQLEIGCLLILWVNVRVIKKMKYQKKFSTNKQQKNIRHSFYIRNLPKSYTEIFYTKI